MVGKRLGGIVSSSTMSAAAALNSDPQKVPGMDLPDRRYGIQRPKDVSLSAMTRSRLSSAHAGSLAQMSSL